MHNVLLSYVPDLPLPCFPLYLTFPWLNGRYLYLTMCLICFFIVTRNRVMKQTTSIGQKTGMFTKLKNVQAIPTTRHLKVLYQNFSSGSCLMKGRNSSLFFVGRLASSSSQSSSAGSILGVRKAMNWFRMNIPTPYVTMYQPWKRVL